jgi:hypothetical protein
MPGQFSPLPAELTAARRGGDRGRLTRGTSWPRAPRCSTGPTRSPWPTSTAGWSSAARSSGAEWDAAYTPIIETFDQGQAPQPGGWLWAKHGKGHYTYFALRLPPAARPTACRGRGATSRRVRRPAGQRADRGALVEFLAQQHVRRDGVEHRFFPGVFGIFGHGNVAGLGQALSQAPSRLPYVLARNEQAMVHTPLPMPSTRTGCRRCLHHVDRARRDQHDHRGRYRHGQPAAGAAAARRHLRPPQCGPRPAAARIPSTAQDVSVNDCLSRSRATGIASTGPTRSCWRCPRPCACSPARPTPAP